MSTQVGVESSAGSSRIGAYAWYALGVMVLVYAMNFIDRQILSILAEDVKADLALTDAQLGFLYGTAFAVFYALFGIPLGRLADSWYRGRLMALGLALWSTMTAVSGLSTSYGMLAAARIGVGIGEASASPAAYSMISDYFPPEKRATALSIYSSGLYIGGGLSLPIGGYILSSWNEAYAGGGAPLGLAGWQAAFLAVGLPGLLLAVWVWTLREPPRGGVEGIGAPTVRPGAWSAYGREMMAILPPLTLFNVARIPGALVPNLAALGGVALAVAALIWLTGDGFQWLAYGLGVYAVFSWVQNLRHHDSPVFRLIWGTPTVVMATIAFGSISFVTYATGFWGAPYVERAFYAEPLGPGFFIGGMTGKSEIATILGWSAAFSAAFGVIIGGIVSDWWRRHDARGRLFVIMLAVVLPAPIVFIMFSTDSLALFYWLNPIAHVFGAMWVGASVATLQDLVLPRMRGTAGATNILGTTMVGLALGPYFAGKVATVTRSLGIAATDAESLRIGVFSLYLVPLVTLTLLWLVSRRVAELEASRVERARLAGETI